MKEDFKVVGRSVSRLDAMDKVTGRARFAGDLHLDGMLYGKILRSPHPHARVVRIDSRMAEKLPGVKAISSILEVPRVNGAIGSLTDSEKRKGLYLLDNGLRFKGDPVLAVAAEDEQTAEEALALIHVEYEELPAVFDPMEAMKDTSPKIHEGGNIAFHLVKEIGEARKWIKEADHVLEDRFSTSKQKHAAIEPMSTCIADYGPSGKLTVYSSTQRPHISKLFLADILGMPVSRVRILKPYTGGAFGGRDYLIHGLESMASFLSRKTLRPVRISFTRKEDFEGTEARHPFIIDVKMGFTREGILTAMVMKAVMDMGGYGPHAVGVLANAMSKALLIYKCPNFSFEGFSVYTNQSLCGAFRGYGNPQVNFAVETIMDRVAERLEMDPVELRLRNYRGLNEIDPLSGKTILSDGMKECLQKGAERFGWSFPKKRRRPVDGKKYGVGMSCLIHHSGGSFIPDPASAIVLFNSDGSVNLVTAAVDDGQGNRTVLAQIAAEELGLRLEQINVASEIDTDQTPIDSGTHGSRQTYAGGIAVKKAAENAKERLLELAAPFLGAEKSELGIKDGAIYQKKRPKNRIPIKDFLDQRLFRDFSKGDQVMGIHTGVAPGWPTIFGANFAEVSVDTLTGEVKVLRLVCAFDVGKAIHPAQVEGQIAGGEILGLGWALGERLITRNGEIINSNFTDYRLVRACDTPKMDIIIVESLEPTGAFGAKGVGEATNSGTAAAVASAIYNAVGVRLNRVPFSQEEILEKTEVGGQRGAIGKGQGAVRQKLRR